MFDIDSEKDQPHIEDYLRVPYEEYVERVIYKNLQNTLPDGKKVKYF